MSNASGSRPPTTPALPGDLAKSTDPLTEVGRPALPPSDAVVRLRVYGGDLELDLPRTKHAMSLGSGLPTQVDLSVPFQYVSRVHATIERDGNWLVVSNRSRNGTYFGGRREERSPVKAGECFTVGQTELLALDDHLVTLRQTLLGRLGFTAHREVDRALIDVADGHQPPLLLTGPRGSEPDLLAVAIHRASPRRELPFEVLDPTAPRAALEAAVERAGGGTVFVDLRPLRAKKAGLLATALFGPRHRARSIVAAPTIESACATLGGRGDHFAVIHTPAVSERRAEIPALLDALLAEIGTTRRLGELAPARMADVCAFEWPDNYGGLQWLAKAHTFPTHLRKATRLEIAGHLALHARLRGHAPGLWDARLALAQVGDLRGVEQLGHWAGEMMPSVRSNDSAAIQAAIKLTDFVRARLAPFAGNPDDEDTARMAAPAVVEIVLAEPEDGQPN